MGMQPDRIEVVPYDPAWSRMFEEERERLAEAFGPYALDIQHVGSTSVPGLAAKPVVDIAVALREYPLPEEVIARVVALGYEHMGEFGLPRRHYFRKGRPRTHHVHAVEPHNPEWEHFILFRDYLRTHPEAVGEYQRLKEALAEEHGHDRVAYTDAKAPFIRGVIEKARNMRD